MGSCLQKDSLSSTPSFDRQSRNYEDTTQSNNNNYFLSKKLVASPDQYRKKHQFILSHMPEKPTSILDPESPTELESKIMQFEKLEGDQPLSAPYSMDELLLTKLQEPIKLNINKRKIRFLSQESDIQSSIANNRPPHPKTQGQIRLKTVLKRNLKRIPKSKSNRSSSSGFGKSVHFSHMINVKYFQKY